MTDKTKIAIIGFGKRGKTHFRNYTNLSNVEVVAICDSNKGVLGGIKIPSYFNYKKVINDYEIDGVSVCVPTKFHYPIARYCLSKGKHVLIEKPVAVTIREAEKLQKLSTKNQLVCMAGYPLRFDRNIKKIKDVLNSGEIGKVIAVRGRQAHNWGGKQPFAWQMDNKISGGGTIIDNASHFLDLFEILLGPIREVGAISTSNGLHSKVEDTALISLKFLNGSIGSIETSWADVRGRNSELIIWGTQSVIEYYESNQGAGLNIASYKLDRDEYNRFVKETLYIPKGVEQTAKDVNIDNNQALLMENTANMLNCFIDLIRNGMAKNEFLKKNNLSRPVALVNSAYKALKYKKSVKVT